MAGVFVEVPDGRVVAVGDAETRHPLFATVAPALGDYSGDEGGRSDVKHQPLTRCTKDGRRHSSMTSNISHSLAVRKTDGDIHQRRQTSATHSLYGRRTHSSKPFDLINAIANFTSAKRQEVHNIDCGQTAK